MRCPQGFRHIVFVASGYPALHTPYDGVFVRQFVEAVARTGVKCTVVHPVAVHRCRRHDWFPHQAVERLPGGEQVVVLRPRFLSLSARASFARLGLLNPSFATLRSFAASVRRAMRQHALHPDALYGHFLSCAGPSVAMIGAELKIPAFVGMGESMDTNAMPWSVRCYGTTRVRRLLTPATGIIANSSLLARWARDVLGFAPERIAMLPNGTDLSRFRPKDKHRARQLWGLPSDRFLVACVGRFSHRKGQARVLEAVRALDNTGVVFIGEGIPYPLDNHVLHNRPLNHDQLPGLLAACDAFVLPTLQEGSCNAIIEAMACGLPIVSSNAEFNDDLLTDDMSIRVDALNVREIRSAIALLRGDSARRRQMAQAALVRSSLFDVNQRARRVLDWMRETVATAHYCPTGNR
jgi:teichuronic acid biosynthesis glycosyltransferase TuaC